MQLILSAGVIQFPPTGWSYVGVLVGEFYHFGSENFVRMPVFHISQQQPKSVPDIDPHALVKASHFCFGARHAAGHLKEKLPVQPLSLQRLQQADTILIKSRFISRHDVCRWFSQVPLLSGETQHRYTSAGTWRKNATLISLLPTCPWYKGTEHNKTVCKLRRFDAGC